MTRFPTSLTVLGSAILCGVLILANTGFVASDTAQLAFGSEGVSHPSGLNGLLPARLSDLGMFSNLATLTPGKDVHLYEVRYPLWSDGTIKVRHVYVPNGEEIGVDEDGWFAMPVGTVITKTFDAPEAIEGRTHRRIETRVLYHTTEGWKTATYVWNDKGNEALRTNDEDQTLNFTLPGSSKPYVVPGRLACLQCHGGVPAFSIGPSSWQLDDATLTRFENEGHFPEESLPLPWREIEADTPIEAAALGYLAGNCAHCHNPNSPNFVGNELDLRHSHAKSAAVDSSAARLVRGDVRLIIKPGELEKSVLYRLFTRTFATDNDPNKFMPPIGNHIVDPHGTKIIRAWIEELGAR